MSALGQKQTCAAQNGMSALPPKADMCSATQGCPLCAKSGHRASSACQLFDDFIGAAEHRRWECETHRLGGLKIDQ